MPYIEHFVGGPGSLINAAMLIAKSGEVVYCHPDDFAALQTPIPFEYKVPLPPRGVDLQEVSRFSCPTFYIRPAIRSESLARGTVWIQT